jgi:hypothetical protein
MSSQRQSTGNTVSTRGRSLQSQGVPIPNKLNGPNKPVKRSGNSTRKSAPPPPHRIRYSSRSQPPNTTNLKDYNPTNVASNTTNNIGILEAEFLVALALLISLMFADGTTDFSSKMMSVMKRGTLVCVLFFILALVASAGDNVAKACKAFGALVIVGILLTSPMATVFKDFDAIIKNDWTGTSETEGGTAPASSNSGNAGATSTEQALQQFAEIIAGDITGAAASTIIGKGNAAKVGKAAKTGESETEKVTGLNANQLGNTPAGIIQFIMSKF